MGFAGTSASSAATLSGVTYFIGGIGLYLAGELQLFSTIPYFSALSPLFFCFAFFAILTRLIGIMEFILGNTFPMIVFMTFGGFWSAYGYFVQPAQGIAAALGAGTSVYNGGFAMYLAAWCTMNLIFFIASLRT